MGKLFLALVVLIFFSFSITALAVEPSMCYGAKFSEIDSLSELPAQIRQQLGANEQHSARIVERSSPYNSTRFVDSELPARRFSMAAVSLDCIFVAYEQGGTSYSVDLRLFLRDGSVWERGEKFTHNEWPLQLGKTVPETLEEMLKYSQYSIGTMYAYGSGAKKDEVEGAKWFKASANQNLASAQFALGQMYANGQGVEKNQDEAVRLFKLAATLDKSYQYLLGLMYKNGETLNQDYKEAFKWLNFAASKGHSGAQVALGSLYANGKGVQKDEVEAVRLFRVALNQGDIFAPYRLAVMYANGRGVVKNNVVAYTLFKYSHLDGALNIVKNSMSAEEVELGDLLCKEMIANCCDDWASVFDVIDNYAETPSARVNKVMQEIKQPDCILRLNGKDFSVLPGGSIKISDDSGKVIRDFRCPVVKTIADLVE